MTASVVAICAAVYLGMILGGLPFLQLDRTGIALLGAIALVSTLAGNLLIVGSIANIIVVAAARNRGIEIGWRRHARTGVPVTLATLAITAGWLALRA